MNFGEILIDNRFDLSKGEDPMIDIGYYVIGLAMYAFDDEMPANQEIACEKNSDGCDLWGNITLKFKEGKHAHLYYNGTMRGSTAAYFAFEKGLIEIDSFFWCPEGFTLIRGEVEEGKKKEFDFKMKDDEGYNLNNCAGLHYEADHVFDQINEGATQSPIHPLNNTMQTLGVIEKLRNKIGVKFQQE